MKKEIEQVDVKQIVSNSKAGAFAIIIVDASGNALSCGSNGNNAIQEHNGFATISICSPSKAVAEYAKAYQSAINNPAITKAKIEIVPIELPIRIF